MSQSTPTGRPGQAYSLRSRYLHERRHRTDQEITDMLSEAEVDSESTESGGDYDEERISVDVSVDDISDYRDLLETIAQSKPKAKEPRVPAFIKIGDEAGYRVENSSSSESEEVASLTLSESQDSQAIPKADRKRKRKTNKVLNWTAMLAIRAELITGRQKVTDTRILEAFLDEEGLSIAMSEKDKARSKIAAQLTILASNRKNSKDNPSGDTIVCDLSTLKVTPGSSKGKTNLKPYNSCTARGKRKKVVRCIKEIEAIIKEKCEKDGVPFREVDRELRKRYTKHLDKKAPTSTETLAHMVSIKATKQTATKIAQFTKRYRLQVPGERVLRREKRKRLVPIHYDRYIETVDGKVPVGVFIKRKHAVKQTLTQLIELKKVRLPAAEEPQRVVLQMTINQGMDGAGSHPEIFGKDAMKLAKSGHSLKACQTFVIVPISCATATEIQLDNGRTDAAVQNEQYRCEKPNSYKNTKVLGLVMESESADLQSFLMEKYPAGKVKYEFSCGDATFVVYCKFVNCLLDGKTRKALSGRGGAYCYYCDITSEAYHTPGGVRVQDSFIKYNNVRAMEEYRQYVACDGQIAMGEKSDDRNRWTNLPSAISEGVVVTHAAINTGSWIIMLAAKVNVFAELPQYKGKEVWEMRGDVLKAKYKEKENEILDGIKNGPQRITMKDVGKGQTGGGTTGNHAKRFLQHGKDILPPLIKDPVLGGKVGKIAELLFVVIRVLNTGNKIDMAVYKHICHSIGILVVTNFPWARINETMHSVLAHSWEIIENNDCRGLKNMSEEGLEALQKHVRKIRFNGAWLGDYLKNLYQTLQMLTLQSDLFLNFLTKKVPQKGKRKDGSREKCLVPDNADDSGIGGLHFLKKVIIKGTSRDGEDSETDEA